MSLERGNVQEEEHHMRGKVGAEWYEEEYDEYAGEFVGSLPVMRLSRKDIESWVRAMGRARESQVQVPYA